MANVYIAAYQVVAGRQHAYLVYDPNEDVNSTSDQLIIRGGPQTPGILPPFGAIIVEAGAASDVSLDGLDNIGDLDGDGFLNNDKIKDGVADRRKIGLGSE